MRKLTLAELYQPPARFRWERHRHLLRDPLTLSSEDVAFILERDRAGFEPWQTAALLRTTIGAVGNVLRLHKRAAA